jgi:hypothetical protein
MHVSTYMHVYTCTSSARIMRPLSESKADMSHVKYEKIRGKKHLPTSFQESSRENPHETTIPSRWRGPLAVNPFRNSIPLPSLYLCFHDHGRHYKETAKLFLYLTGHNLVCSHWARPMKGAQCQITAGLPRYNNSTLK